MSQRYCAPPNVSSSSVTALYTQDCKHVSGQDAMSHNALRDEMDQKSLMSVCILQLEFLRELPSNNMLYKS